MRKHTKKYNIRLISQVYTELGCSKSNISRWEHNPCSTQALCKNAKLAVIEKTEALFELTEQEREDLANKAGISLSEHENGLAGIMTHYQSKYYDLLKKMAVSERMLQYYIAGKEPTKQSLLAISISLEMSPEDLQRLLPKYGYCLSQSLANDAVVQWFLANGNGSENVSLLYSINEVLEYLDLPMLMTKSYNR